MVALRRRTVVRHTTPGSLGVSATADGRYLAGAERSAENLLTAVRALPGGTRRLEGQARGSLHLARAITAVARGADDDTIRAHLAIAADVVPPAESAYSLATRIRRDLSAPRTSAAASRCSSGSRPVAARRTTRPALPAAPCGGSRCGCAG